MTTQHVQSRDPDLRTDAFARTCARLRALNPDCPRVYAVAAMSDEGKRRWWRLSTGLESDRVDHLLSRSLQDLDNSEAAATQVATSLIHAIVGRVAASIVADGTAWDPGLENLWIHMDNDSSIDWAGVADETLRVAPGSSQYGRDGVVEMPCEAALSIWAAHRCLTSLRAVHSAVSRRAPIDSVRFWGLVGESILGATAYVPILAGEGETAAWRRGQGLLDAFVGAGVPVRARRKAHVRPRWSELDQALA
ncbi:hypothetical protein [Rhodococcus sp. IEGM 1379]|uniref:hypothetical protein n=1 Tax=Rhodococcus sp. IEGM 1379 TaxID=3047086 RepID=UPI0024B7680D|nr:hypothetical protein [Rhodococcus sp. IEGM 1379]MDI9913780.1 hypothetical protein [Rhodococcus sp. IEGM 1379]